MFQISAILALPFIGYQIVNAFDCCIDAETPENCAAVASGCMYIGDDAAALPLAAGAVCVTPSWFECTVNGVCPPPPPVPPAPSDCIIDTCDNNVDTYNVGFIVDESGSVGSKDYTLTLDYFVKKMIKENLNEDSLVSFLSFATGIDRNWLFTDKGGPGNTNREGVLGAVEREKNDYRGGSTCLGHAVREMITDFTEDLSRVNEIERGDNNVLFILTDGMAACMNDCADYAKDLKDNRIVTYIVGITSGFSPKLVECLVRDQVNPLDPRYDITRRSVDDYILTIPKFKEDYFYSLQMQLRSAVCPPIVFEEEEEAFVNKLDAVLTGANNDMINEDIFYVISLALLIIGGFVCYFRDRLCLKNKDEKYIPLKDESHGQYQSV